MGKSMNRREFLVATGSCVAGTGLARWSYSMPQPPSSKPNILIIMADQMTAALTGAYGHPVVKTPALSQLAKEGVLFESAYTNSPLCTPARAAMLSGLYVSRTRTYDNGSILPADIPTYAHHLRRAGYEVVASGKMHLVGADQLHGFERRLTRDIYPTHFGWTPSWEEYERSGIANSKGVLIEKASLATDNKQMQYDSGVQKAALEFIRSRSARTSGNQERPFCLLVSFTHPHPPYQITKEFWDMYEGAVIDIPELTDDIRNCRSQMDRWLLDYEGVPEDVLKDKSTTEKMRRIYYGMMTYVDSLVGEILQTLKENGLKDNTAIVFTSDHGDMLGERQLVEKRNFYEWSSRIPMIASFPHAWAKGVRCTELVSLIDIFPTLVEFIGEEPPAEIDGRSFLGQLKNPRTEGSDRTVISEYHGEGVVGACFMARKGRYKYVHIHGHAPQLFDLEQDPGEVRNLAGQEAYRSVEESLRTIVLTHFEPERIERDVQRSQKERILMKDAMNKGEKVLWESMPD